MKRIITTSVLCLTIGFVAAGCGGSDDSAASSSASSSGQQPADGPSTAGGRSPGGSGEVVDVSGSTAQVKGQDSQVAVTWTGSTTFTKQVSGSATDVAVGSCVMVTPVDPSSTTDAVAAGSVRITEAADGACSIGGGGGAGRPGGTPPSGAAPDERRSGKPGAPRGGFAVGEVTAVTDAGFTVSSQRPDADAATTVEVTISGDTTYTKTAEAAASDVKVGACVTSRGDADETGAITATTIAIAEPVDGACTTAGFRGGRPGDASGAPAAADAA